MLEERAADRHDANVGAMGYRAKENRQQHGADRGLSYRVVCGAEAWRLARRPSRVTEGEMDEQRGDVSSVRHRSSLAPTFFVICPASMNGRVPWHAVPELVYSDKMDIKCLAISGLGAGRPTTSSSILCYPVEIPSSVLPLAGRVRIIIRIEREQG